MAMAQCQACARSMQLYVLWCCCVALCECALCSTWQVCALLELITVAVCMLVAVLWAVQC